MLMVLMLVSFNQLFTITAVSSIDGDGFGDDFF
jgi:hypothetical protein